MGQNIKHPILFINSSSLKNEILLSELKDAWYDYYVVSTKPRILKFFIWLKCKFYGINPQGIITTPMFFQGLKDVVFRTWIVTKINEIVNQNNNLFFKIDTTPIYIDNDNKNTVQISKDPKIKVCSNYMIGDMLKEHENVQQ